MMRKPDDLHRLHDGELSDEERRAVEAALDDDGRARLLVLDEIGAVLRHTLETESASFDVAAVVMKRLATPPAPSLIGRLRAAVGTYRMVWIPGMAAAALVSIFYLGPFRQVITDNCEIDSLEVTGAVATVFKLSDVHGDGTSTVVWLDEEAEEESR